MANRSANDGMTWTPAYVGLGSNLDNPQGQLDWAIEKLRELESVRGLVCSDYVVSSPMGPQNQPDYLNAVCCFETTLGARALLLQLHNLEDLRGRVRQRRWGPRTLDLDLLVYGSETRSGPGLRLPHPGIHERSFVLYPLAQIAPALFIPGKGWVSELVQACDTTNLRPFDAAGAARQ